MLKVRKCSSNYSQKIEALIAKGRLHMAFDRNQQQVKDATEVREAILMTISRNFYIFIIFLFLLWIF